jgi:hypothetical protein
MSRKQSAEKIAVVFFPELVLAPYTLFNKDGL